MIARLLNEPVVLAVLALVVAAIAVREYARGLRREPTEAPADEIPELPVGDMPRLCASTLARRGHPPVLRCGLLAGHKGEHYDPLERLPFITFAELRLVDEEKPS